ncbi:MAG TPA: hypothetical protein VHG71_01335 [Verrucomicrobiae bacterium]|nr:hypothetical protein [Verrucomicrobiae bacterium]
MKSSFWLLIGISILICGCSSTPHTPRDPAAKFYQNYAGTQNNLPTSQFVFSRQVEGVTFYNGFPPYPYTIIGSISGQKLRDAIFARSAKFHGADAVAMVTDKQIVVGEHTDNGMMFFGGKWIYTTPSTTKTIFANYREALLIKTNSISTTH